MDESGYAGPDRLTGEPVGGRGCDAESACLSSPKSDRPTASAPIPAVALSIIAADKSIGKPASRIAITPAAAMACWCSAKALPDEAEHRLVPDIRALPIGGMAAIGPKAEFRASDPLDNALALRLLHQRIAQAQQFLADRFQLPDREAAAQGGNMLAEPGAEDAGEAGLALG